MIHSTQQGKPRIDLKLGGANIFIAAVAPSDGVNAPSMTPYQGPDHSAVAAELKAKGAEFSKEPHSPRPKSAFCVGRRASPSNCSSATRNTPKSGNFAAIP